MAPLKALCSEKFNEWSDKFDKLHNLKCIELTGDTDHNSDTEMNFIDSANIICTTPVSFQKKNYILSFSKIVFNHKKEKWDMVTRKIKDRDAIINSIKLFLVDEVHVLGENSRGAVIEAVISRMKTYANKRIMPSDPENSMRFVAVSATIPNIDDVRIQLSNY